MIVIDSQSRQPIYEQIVEHVESLIAAGVMSQGEQLPSVRALAVELSINPNTIQKAYAILEEHGGTVLRAAERNRESGEKTWNQ